MTRAGVALDRSLGANTLALSILSHSSKEGIGSIYRRAGVRTRERQQRECVTTTPSLHQASHVNKPDITQKVIKRNYLPMIVTAAKTFNPTYLPTL